MGKKKKSGPCASVRLLRQAVSTENPGRWKPAHENQNQEHQNEKTRQDHSDPGRFRPVRVGEGDGPWGETRRYGEGRGRRTREEV